MKYSIAIILLLATQFLLGQSTVLKYKNEIKKGFCEDENQKCINKQFRYLNACDKLGDFYLKSKNYKMAFKYYELPLALNRHSTTIQTDSAYKLRNAIIAKAGDMIFKGTGLPRDTVESFYYHLHYPLTYSLKYKEKYSLLYFRTLKDTFNLLSPDSIKNKFYIAINPFMLSEKSVLQKISRFIFNNVLNKSNLNLIIHRGQIPFSDDGQRILSMSLNKLVDVIRLSNEKLKINTEVDFSDPNATKIVNGRSFPILVIE